MVKPTDHKRLSSGVVAKKGSLLGSVADPGGDANFVRLS
jgi:hypothetical protein